MVQSALCSSFIAVLCWILAKLVCIHPLQQYGDCRIGLICVHCEHQKSLFGLFTESYSHLVFTEDKSEERVPTCLMPLQQYPVFSFILGPHAWSWSTRGLKESVAAACVAVQSAHVVSTHSTAQTAFTAVSAYKPALHMNCSKPNKSGPVWEVRVCPSFSMCSLSCLQRGSSLLAWQMSKHNMHALLYIHIAIIQICLVW